MSSVNLSIKYLQEIANNGTPVLCLPGGVKGDNWTHKFKKFFPSMEILDSYNVQRFTDRVIFITDVINHFMEFLSQQTKTKLAFNSNVINELDGGSKEIPWNGYSIWSLNLRGKRIYWDHQGGISDENGSDFVQISTRNGILEADPCESDFIILSKSERKWLTRNPSRLLEAVAERKIQRIQWDTSFNSFNVKIDVHMEISRGTFLSGFNFWTNDNNTKHLLIRHGGKILDNPSSDCIVVVIDKLNNGLTDDDLCIIRKERCVILEESWMRSACSKSEFGKIADGLVTCPYPKPFPLIHYKDFRNRKIHIIGNVPEALKGDLEELSSLKVDNVDQADTIICCGSSLESLPVISRTFSCYQIYRDSKKPHACKPDCYPIIIPPEKTELLVDKTFYVWSTIQKGHDVSDAIQKMSGTLVDRAIHPTLLLWDEISRSELLKQWLEIHPNVKVYSIQLIRDVIQYGWDYAEAKNMLQRQDVYATVDAANDGCVGKRKQVTSTVNTIPSKRPKTVGNIEVPKLNEKDVFGSSNQLLEGRGDEIIERSATRHISTVGTSAAAFPSCYTTPSNKRPVRSSVSEGCGRARRSNGNTSTISGSNIKYRSAIVNSICTPRRHRSMNSDVPRRQLTDAFENKQISNCDTSVNLSSTTSQSESVPQIDVNIQEEAVFETSSSSLKLLATEIDDNTERSLIAKKLNGTLFEWIMGRKLAYSSNTTAAKDIMENELLKVFRQVNLDVVDRDELNDKMQHKGIKNATLLQGPLIAAYGVIAFNSLDEQMDWCSKLKTAMKTMIKGFGLNGYERTIERAAPSSRHLSTRFKCQENVLFFSSFGYLSKRVPERIEEFVIYRTLLDFIDFKYNISSKVLHPIVGVVCDQNEDSSCVCKSVHTTGYYEIRVKDENMLPDSCDIIALCREGKLILGSRGLSSRGLSSTSSNHAVEK